MVRTHSEIDMGIVAFDVETGLINPDGTTTASTEAYHPDFRVLSAAFSWFDGGETVSKFIQGEDTIAGFLRTEFIQQSKLLVHNLQFELMVCRCRYPNIKLNIAIDSMRLAQVYDNGGDKNAFEVIIDEEYPLEEGELPSIKKIATAGLGLVKCAYRILGESASHKKEAHDWIRANVPKSKGKEGQFLDKLPPDILERYNIADTETTLRLYKYITEYFVSIGYDWFLDHQLYKSTASFVVDAEIRGTPVDRPLAIINAEGLRQEIAGIEAAFATRYKAEIASVEADRLEKWCSLPKTEKGRQKRRLRCETGDTKAMENVTFNAGSNLQLGLLFMGKMGMVPKFFTKKGAPAFRSSMLGQWGEPGLMLQKRRKRMIILSQLESLLEASALDGKWHIKLKVAGTGTSRLAGGQH